MLILKRASTFCPSGEWNDDDFDVLTDGIVVGRIMKAAAVLGQSWNVSPSSNRTPTQCYAATREAAMPALPQAGLTWTSLRALAGRRP